MPPHPSHPRGRNPPTQPASPEPNPPTSTPPSDPRTSPAPPPRDTPPTPPPSGRTPNPAHLRSTPHLCTTATGCPVRQPQLTASEHTSPPTCAPPSAGRGASDIAGYRSVRLAALSGRPYHPPGAARKINTKSSYGTYKLYRLPVPPPPAGSDAPPTPGTAYMAASCTLAK